MREASVLGSTDRRRLEGIALACVTLLALVFLLALSGPAQALSQRGHVFAGSFGKEGSGAGELKDPAGVAVNESTGDVYVVDSGNNRVDRFSANGEFISAWGYGVTDGKKEFEICTTTCKAGLAAKGKGEMHGARSIAIDNSTSTSDPSRGDIYVEVLPFEVELENGHEVEREEAVIDKFTPEGKLVEKGSQISGWRNEGFFEEIEEPFGITVGPTGTLYLYDEEYVVAYTNGMPNKFKSIVESEPFGEEAPGIAVDAAGNYDLATSNPPGSPPEIAEFNAIGEEALETIYDQPTSGIAYEYGRDDYVLDNVHSVAVLDSSHSLVQTLGDEEEIHEGAGVAVSSASEDIYVVDAAAGRVVRFVPEPPGEPTFGEAYVSGLEAASVELTAKINPHGGEATTYTFRYSTGTVPGPGEPCVSPCVEAPAAPAALGSEGFSEVTTPAQKLEGLTAKTRYQYRVWAQNTVQEGGEKVVHTVESAEYSFVAPYLTGSTLPDGRAWEQVSPLNKNGAALVGIPNEGAVIQAAANGEGLTYVASGAVSNCEGNPEPEGNRAPNLSQLVAKWSPSGWCTHDIDTKHEKGEGLIPDEGNGYQLFSSDLSSAVLETFGSEAFEHPPLTGESTQERTPYVRANSAECLQSPAPTSCFTALVDGSNSVGAYGDRVHFAGGNANLSKVVLESSVALTSQAVPSKRNLYERGGSGEAGLELVSVLPNGQPASNAALGVHEGAVKMNDHALSEDGTRVVFTTYSVGFSEATEHLYLRDTESGETVQLDKQEAGVSVPSEIYPAPASSYEHPYFQDASSNGSTVFFTDEWRLTKDSTAAPGEPDLYACTIVKSASTGELECKLADLTVDTNADQHAAVQGILGSGSQPASGKEPSSTSVYFVANGALASGSNASKCQAFKGWGAKEAEEQEEGVPVEAHELNLLCNLYVEHYDAASSTWSLPKLVAILSQEDEPDWLSIYPGKAGTRGDLGDLTSRVSPDGERLAFMSDRDLTNYNTRDVATGRGDEEVYSFDDEDAKLACVSCNPSGGRPKGILDTESAGEGIGLLADRQLIWIERRLSANIPGWTNWEGKAAYYQSRYLNNEGRVFFNSVEALVPQDKNGKEDVYEYEPAGIGGCTSAAETYSDASEGCISLISSGTSTHESAFLDASESGNDVFFLTDSQLVEADKDTSFDVYDATVCGREGARACLQATEATKAPCEELRTCRPEGEETSPTVPFAAPSATSGSGSPSSAQHEVLGTKTESKPTVKAKPLTRAQKLAKALKACKKLRNHKKRTSCERTARKRYGVKKAKKASAHHAVRRGR